MKTHHYLLALWLTFALTKVGAQDKLSLEDYLNFEWVSNPQISPDGQQILYQRGWIDAINDQRRSDLWIVHADGSLNRSFGEGSNGIWSPDGKRIAFTKKGEPSGTQIFIKYLGVEGATQITRLEESPSNISWSPDGKYLAFTMFVPKNKGWNIKLPPKPDGAKWTKSPRIVDELVYRRDRRGFLENGHTHIFLVSAQGGTARQITEGDYNFGGRFSWTPDGKHIIFSSLMIPEAEYANRESQLYAIEVATKKVTQITDRKGNESNPLVSPNGKMIAFVGSEWTENFYQAQNLYACNLDGSNLRVLTKDLDRRIRGGEVIWARDNSGLYYTVEDQGTFNLYFSSNSGKWKKITEGNHVLNTSSISASGKAVGVRASYHQLLDLVTYDVQNPQLRTLINVNEDMLYGKTLGEVEEIRYKSKDGLEIQGWIVKPPFFDPSKKYPLILRIHGGPHGMYNVAFNLNYQLHAAEGYVVLYTNPRGSTGYGYDFANAIQNAYPGKDYDDLMSGVDEVIKKGYIDENRLYVYGGSGGGVLTAWIVGHTDRFAAASANYPVINWMSFVGTTDGVGWYRNFKKKPWEDPSEHIRRSPLTYVGNVKTPTMLMTGVKDLRTPISQTEEFYQALKVQKVPTVMIRFNEEYHGTASKPSNFMRSMAYHHYWFAQWRKDGKVEKKAERQVEDE
ncbi:MAG: S9 family peptidase [Bacteroidota bacterium]